ncbi:hypothetical protein L9F63_017918, partial [Diploptera punctata]
TIYFIYDCSFDIKDRPLLTELNDFDNVEFPYEKLKKPFLWQYCLGICSIDSVNWKFQKRTVNKKDFTNPQGFKKGSIRIFV